MKILAGENGITLIELLVTISILAVVVAATSMAVISLMKLSPLSSNWAVALTQVQNTGYWISRDVQMSDNMTVDNNPATRELVTLRQPIWDDSSGSIVYKTFAYRFDESTPTRLMRTDEDTGAEVFIADHLSNATVSYTDNCSLIVDLTAVVGGATVNRQYEASQRVPAE